MAQLNTFEKVQQPDLKVSSSPKIGKTSQRAARLNSVKENPVEVLQDFSKGPGFNNDAKNAWSWQRRQVLEELES